MQSDARLLVHGVPVDMPSARAHGRPGERADVRAALCLPASRNARWGSQSVARDCATAEVCGQDRGRSCAGGSHLEVPAARSRGDRPQSVRSPQRHHEGGRLVVQGIRGVSRPPSARVRGRQGGGVSGIRARRPLIRPSADHEFARVQLPSRTACIECPASSAAAFGFAAGVRPVRCSLAARRGGLCHGGGAAPRWALPLMRR